VLQLAVLASIAPGASLSIHDCQIWNQLVEAANGGKVSIANSAIHGSLFLARDSGSSIAINGGAFYANPAGCTQNTMVDIATGQPKCSPFRPPGLPRAAGPGKIGCTDTVGCIWAH
jgi:hypothetical protein